MKKIVLLMIIGFFILLGGCKENTVLSKEEVIDKLYSIEIVTDHFTYKRKENLREYRTDQYTIYHTNKTYKVTNDYYEIIDISELIAIEEDIIAKLTAHLDKEYIYTEDTYLSRPVYNSSNYTVDKELGIVLASSDITVVSVGTSPTITFDDTVDIVINNEVTSLEVDEEYIPNIQMSKDTLLLISANNDNVVINNGVITAKKEGPVTITYQALSSIYTQTIEVLNTQIITIKNEISSLEVDEEYIPIIELKKEEALEIIINSEIAKIENGVITALKEGAFVITYQTATAKYDQTIQVLPSSLNIAFKWIEEQYKDKMITGDITFPTVVPNTNVLLSVYIFDPEYMSDDGKYTPPILDFVTDFLFYLTYKGQEYELMVPVTFVGYGDEFDDTYKYLTTVVPEELTIRIQLPKVYNHGATLEWSSDYLNISEYGVVTYDRPEEKKLNVNLSCKVTINNEVRVYDFTTIIWGLSDEEKVNEVLRWLNGIMKEGISENVELPTTDLEYSSTITWKSWSPYVITNNGYINRPLYNTSVDFDCTIRVNSSATTTKITYEVLGFEYANTWEKVEKMLEWINIKRINTQRFYLYGSEPGYYTVATSNIGYLPFYDDEEMTIIQELLPSTSNLKPNRNRQLTKYIVIHNTGMAAPSATAKGLSEYIHTTDRVASWHFSIDDKETYQQLDINEIGWHAGDSEGNNYGIGIESCVYAGVDFNNVMRRLAKLTASLLLQFNLDLTDIRQHYDFTQKDCPQVIRHANRWNELLMLVQIEYFALTELQGVTFKWTSNSKEYMDDTGRVIHNPGYEVKINYSVDVTFENQTRTYNYSSILEAFK